MKAKFHLLIAAVISLMTACKKDFLDRYPQTEITPEVFFNTEEDLGLYINGLLSLPDRYSYLNDQSSDNAATTAAVEIKSMMTGTPSSQTITGGWSWSRLRNINYFLENYQKANISDEVKNHYVGLARYYRAIFYQDMVKRYSDVPWYSGTLNPSDEELYNARDSRELVMDSVRNDLEFAVTHVREDVPTGTPGKWAVATMLAKITLYEGTYRKYHPELNLASTAESWLEEAAETAEEIMNEGGFHIYNTGKPEADYAALFNSQDLLSNPEIILANPFDQTKNHSQDINSVVFGDYEQSPSKDLVQTYLMTDGSRFTDQPDFETFSYVQEFKNRDPRLKQTLVYPGWTRVPEPTPYVVKLNKNFTGYYQLKGYVNSTDQVILNGVDFPVHRYAEVLLIYAEAKAELGTLNQDDLDISVNLLRRRVGMPDLNMAQANASPDAFQAQKFPNLNSQNQGVILEIRRERRVELSFENTRYDDLMRWHGGKLLTFIPQGMYFSGLGNDDVTGDGVPDIKLIPEGQTIPDNREKNSLGVPLVYYTVGSFGSGAGVFLEHGSQGGMMVTDNRARAFIEPKYYYRPIPQTQMVLNPKLKQIFDWE